MRIALTGHKGSGKDTVANYLKKQHSYVKLAFADPIRTEVKKIFQLDSDEEYDTFKRTRCFWEEHGQFEGRHAVRELGMLMRSYDTDQFCRYIEHKVVDDGILLPVITDLRFDNEYRLLKWLNFKIIKVIGPEQPVDMHITERGFADEQCDYILDNVDQSNIIMIEQKVDIMLQELCNV